MPGYSPILNRFYTLHFTSSNMGTITLAFGRDDSSSFSGTGTSDFGFGGGDVINASIFLNAVGGAIETAFNNAMSNSFGTMTFDSVTGPSADQTL